MLGSDSGAQDHFYGFAAHRELELMVAAGLSPMDAILTATVRSAERLGLDDAGRLVAGARADFVVLEHARGYVPGGNARIFTEQAHYAAEFSLKAVIVSRGGTFSTTHNIQELPDATRRLGETIPAAGLSRSLLNFGSGRSPSLLRSRLCYATSATTLSGGATVSRALMRCGRSR